MKLLTWAMLKEKIEQMNEQEQQEPVRVWGEDMPLKSEIILDRANENMYYNDDFDGVCYPESLLYDYNPEDCILVAKKEHIILIYIDMKQAKIDNINKY